MTFASVSVPGGQQRRRFGLQILCLLGGLPLSNAMAAPGAALPGVKALQTWLKAQPQSPAIVMLSLPGCPVCEVVRREQLMPLRKDHQYKDLGVFEISMRDNISSLPLNGDFIAPSHGKFSPQALSEDLKIRVSPTLLFLNRGAMLAEPLVGYPSRDFYWGFLSERIETARATAARAA